jgi:mono/diheme cytochrome c family protein
MPTFAWRLSDEQLAEVVTYIRNAWGDAAADRVQAIRRKRGTP